jgi:hypothetical protein
MRLSIPWPWRNASARRPIAARPPTRLNPLGVDIMRKALTLLLLLCLATVPCLAAAETKVSGSSPFSYGVGCDYDPWNQKWTAYSVADQIKYVGQDLDKLTQYFSMFHTYHDAAVGTSTLGIEPGTLGILTYVKDHPDKGLQLFFCTNEDAATSSKLGSLDYARNWVKTILLEPLGNNTHLVSNTIKAIGIGNEIDAQSVFSPSDLGKAVKNLATALNEAGLGSIPITTTIANITSNTVANSYIKALESNWQSSWGEKFIFANNFPWMQGQSVKDLESWYAKASAEYSSWSIYIGETGYPTSSDPSCWFDRNFPRVSGGAGEYTYTADLFNWLGDVYNQNNHHTVTTFVFGGFDEPKKDPNCSTCSENHYGLLKDDGTPKTDSKGKTISIPGWIKHEN